jgi:hypothetical protein
LTNARLQKRGRKRNKDTEREGQREGEREKERDREIEGGRETVSLRNKVSLKKSSIKREKKRGLRDKKGMIQGERDRKK